MFIVAYSATGEHITTNKDERLAIGFARSLSRLARQDIAVLRRLENGTLTPWCCCGDGAVEYPHAETALPAARREFCPELTIANPSGDISNPGDRHFPVTKYNNTDDDCLKPLKTNPLCDGT